MGIILKTKYALLQRLEESRNVKNTATNKSCLSKFIILEKYSADFLNWKNDYENKNEMMKSWFTLGISYRSAEEFSISEYLQVVSKDKSGNHKKSR